MTESSPFPSHRPGEVALAVDPADADDASLAFIGRVRSPWRERGACPKNMHAAREAGSHPAFVEIDAPFRPALEGLEPGAHVFLLTWLHRAGRDLALQRPRHAERSTGTFALRSPVRPNPIGLHLVRITAIDPEAGRIEIDAVDVLDETPLLDIKPFFASVDVPPVDAP